jgi:hypothetical protein
MTVSGALSGPSDMVDGFVQVGDVGMRGNELLAHNLEYMPVYRWTDVDVYRNIWTPPALQAASLLLETGSDCSNIALSPGLKIRVSVVQFHPWRPFRKCPFRVLR